MIVLIVLIVLPKLLVLTDRAELRLVALLSAVLAAH